MRTLQPNIWEYGVLYESQQNWKFIYGANQINVDYSSSTSSFTITIINKICLAGGWRFMNSLTYPGNNGNMFAYFFERLKE